MEHYHHCVMCLGVVVMINLQCCQLVRYTGMLMGVFLERMS